MRERAADRGAFSLKNGDPSARADRQVMRLCLSARQDHRFFANGCLLSAARSLISDWVFDHGQNYHVSRRYLSFSQKRFRHIFVTRFAGRQK